MGLQLLGPPLDEERVLALARQIQEVLPIDLSDLSGRSMHWGVRFPARNSVTGCEAPDG